MIDLRSDTVTRPTVAMREAMASAEVGDDVYGDDPTINAFQEEAAAMLGHEAALFMPTGTQTNLVALLTHCQRGDEYIVGGDAHTYKYEGGGAAALGGIQPQTLPFGANGELDLDAVQVLIKEDDVHFAKTRLLCLENTQHGRVQPLLYMQQAQCFARDHGLSLHLDGARMANAAVALDITLKDMGTCFDTVSLCLSKGLGAPVGSILAGNSDFIEQARRWRKVTGGGWRQAGVLAACGQLALSDGVTRLAEDHENARHLARQLQQIEALSVRDDWTQTNMVWVDLHRDHREGLGAFARSRDVLLSTSRDHIRFVLHRDVSRADVDTAISVISDYFSAEASAFANSPSLPLRHPT